MISVQKMNALNGTTVSRSEIENIIETAKQENATAVIYRLSKVLNDNPNDTRFEMTIRSYPQPQGLAGTQHTGDYREALDECGRLRKGYKFVKGSVVKVEPKKVGAKNVLPKEQNKDCKTCEKSSKKQEISFKDLDLSEFEPFEKNELLREALGLGKEFQGKVYLEKYVADFYLYGKNSKKYTSNLKQGIKLKSVEDRCQKIELDGRVLYISKKKTLDYFSKENAEHRRNIDKEIRKKKHNSPKKETDFDKELFVKIMLPLYQKSKENPNKYAVKNGTENIFIVEDKAFWEAFRNVKNDYLKTLYASKKVKISDKGAELLDKALKNEPKSEPTYKFLLYKTQTSNKYTLAFSYVYLSVEDEDVFYFRKKHKGKGYNEYFVQNNLALLEKYKKGVDYLILSKEDFDKKEFYKQLKKKEVDYLDKLYQKSLKIDPKAKPLLYEEVAKKFDIHKIQARFFHEEVRKVEDNLGMKKSPKGEISDLIDGIFDGEFERFFNKRKVDGNFVLYYYSDFSNEIISYITKKQNLKKYGLAAPQPQLTTEDFKKMTVSELRKFTLEYYNTHLKGKKTAIKNHLKEVVFVSGAGRKLMQPIYKEKVAVMEHLEELIKNSTYNNWGNRKKTDSPDVLGYLNFKSKLIIDGEKKHIRISVIVDDKRKTRFKSFEVGTKPKKEASIRRVHFGNPKAGQIETSFDDKNTQNSEQSKKTDENFGLSAPQPQLTTEDFKNMTVKELREFTLDYYNKNLKGKTAIIKKYLKEVVFTTKAGRKIAFGEGMYSAKAVAVKHLQELIENSTYNNWGDRKTTDSKDVLGYLNFKSKLVIDGEKRHVRISLTLLKGRKTELKNIEVGRKKKATKPTQEPELSLQDDEALLLSKKNGKTPMQPPAVSCSREAIRLSDDKGTQNSEQSKKTDENFGLSVPQVYVETIDNEAFDDVKPTAPIPVRKGSLAEKIQQVPTSWQSYQIDRLDMAQFLGDVEIKNVDSLVITLTGGQGSGKTRFAFQFMNDLAQHYKVGHISIEEHPESRLYLEKVNQYLDATAQNNIEAHDVRTLAELHQIIERNDVIVIDSFQKIKELDSKFEVDKDLRKKYNGKLFLVIFQQTTDGKMRGGAKSQFDGDIILFTAKFPNYQENYVYPDKNRYNSLPTDQLKYSIYQQGLLTENETQTAENQVYNVVY